MLIRTRLDGGRMISTESAIIEFRPYETDGEIWACVGNKEIEIGVYRSPKIANRVMDDIYTSVQNGCRAYTMPGYDYGMED